jgi:hypothetical protein
MDENDDDGDDRNTPLSCTERRLFCTFDLEVSHKTSRNYNWVITYEE